MRRFVMVFPAALACLGLTAASMAAGGFSWLQYGGNAQHTGLSGTVSQRLKKIWWQRAIDEAPQYSGSALLIHYTPPMISESGMAVVPVKTTPTGGYFLRGINKSGAVLWSMATDYIPAPAGWAVPCGAALYKSPAGKETAAIIAAAGGRILYRGSVDYALQTPSPQVFYGAANYNANPNDYNAKIFINTPLSVDPSNGAVFFGFRATGDTALHLQSGLARVIPGGATTYRSVSYMTNGASTGMVATNCSPTLSNDGTTLYFATSGGTPYLVSVNATTLAPIAMVQLKDPSNGNLANVFDQSTASPMVGPDHTVYYGILENPLSANHFRGFMLHFSANLAVQYPSGDFGWDDTPAIVPKTAVPDYLTASPYLILTKYNNYMGTGGDGHNKVAVLDPYQTQIDPQTGMVVMKEVRTILSPTPDGNGAGGMVREWCVNSVAVDPGGKCAILNCEDGKAYRWDLVTGALVDAITLGVGIGQAYTSTVIGPDGRCYAINNGMLFALGDITPPR
jgi:hypothetical protein